MCGLCRKHERPTSRLQRRRKYACNYAWEYLLMVDGFVYPCYVSSPSDQTTSLRRTPPVLDNTSEKLCGQHVDRSDALRSVGCCQEAKPGKGFGKTNCTGKICEQARLSRGRRDRESDNGTGIGVFVRDWTCFAHCHQLQPECVVHGDQEISLDGCSST